jgi:sodium/proline symporter
MASVGAYFVALDVLAPSFAVAMLVGFIVSKKYPPRAAAIQMIEEIDASPERE